jgi:3-oxoacyl-[acyl-carrier-protein] synthase II
MEDRVVVTGMGTVNPLGLCVEETWNNAINGISGVAPITLFDTDGLPVKLACEVKNFKPENYMPAKEARRRDRYQHFAVAAVQEAVNQAGFHPVGEDAARVGIVISSSIGGLKSLQDAVLVQAAHGARKVSAFTIPMLMPNGASGMVAIDYGLYGPSLSVASACASAADGIGIAWMMIKSGMIDSAITGGSECTLTSVGIATFDRLGAMSRRSERTGTEKSPYMTPQPFDLNRDGLIMGEGAAILILEKESNARARGAEILAEIAAYAATSDAFHVTAPDENGVGSARAMELAMQSARLNPEDIGYINAHGTATPLNDISETQAIKSAFGNFAYNIPVSSTKSMTGHMMGSTGALEAIFCIQAVREGVLPPTINYQTPDPKCDLDYVPNEARRKKVTSAMSNAFGFGGHNSVLVVRSV